MYSRIQDAQDKRVAFECEKQFIDINLIASVGLQIQTHCVAVAPLTPKQNRTKIDPVLTST